MLEIFVGLVSMVISGIAIVLAKKGLDELPVDPGRNFFKISLMLIKNKWWFMGGSLLVVGWLLRFVAINISDFTFVRMTYVTHLLIVIVGSKLLLKEKLGNSLIISIIIILSGLLFVSASPTLTRTEEGNILRYSAFSIVMIILIVTAFLSTILVSHSKNFFYALCSACCYGLGAVTQGVFAVNLLDLQSLTDLSFYISLLLEPLAIIMIFFSAFGYIFGNLMAYRFKISLSYSIEYPLSEAIVFIGSVVVFNEDLSFITNPNRVLGILLLMIGLMVAIITQRKYIIKPRLFPLTS